MTTNSSHPDNSQTSLKTIALVGNPNSGKSTLFNALTGLNQKTGNFPGVTVDKKSGFFRIPKGDSFTSYRIIDLPGTYSLYPKSLDEKVTSEVLFDTKGILVIPAGAAFTTADRSAIAGGTCFEYG